VKRVAASQAMAAARGSVIIHASAMLRTVAQSSVPAAAPTPAIDPTETWVVDTGRPGASVARDARAPDRGEALEVVIGAVAESEEQGDADEEGFHWCCSCQASVIVRRIVGRNVGRTSVRHPLLAD
jgi:hypothetical protein